MAVVWAQMDVLVTVVWIVVALETAVWIVGVLVTAVWTVVALFGWWVYW